MQSSRGDTAKAAIVQDPADPFALDQDVLLRPRTSLTSRQAVPGCDSNSMRTRKDDRGRGPTLQKSDVNSDAKDLLACMADELSVANNTATAEDYISDSARNALASGAASDAVLLDGGANCPITNNMMHCSNMRKVNRKITVGGNQHFNY